MWVLLAARAQGQDIRIQANEMEMNQLLVLLRDTYNLQLSFNDEMLRKYTVTCNRSFTTVREAIEFIIRDYPLRVDEVDGVYIIGYQPIAISHTSYSYQGYVEDAFSGERLPFCNIQLANRGLVTDQQGYFAFTDTDSLVHLKIAYLGYHLIDSTATASTQLTFGMFPASLEIKEIEIIDERIEWSPKLGNEAGESRLNQQVAMFLPGFGDNAVFNLLRLQPGILAAGEQSSDLLIWGGYEGQSMVQFDGFTVFGLKNFNDNISAINPYMVKDIKILKGGYSADYGERVSGIIDITGIDGSRKKPELKVNLDNMTLNGMVSVPLFKSTSLVLASRQTYYALYNNFTNQRKNDSTVLTIRPDYKFSDYNLKYSGQLGARLGFSFSGYSGNDTYEERFQPETRDPIRKAREVATTDQNKQQAASIMLSYPFLDGMKMNLSGSNSKLRSNYKFQYSELWLRRDIRLLREVTASNNLDESSLELSLEKATQNATHQLKTAVGWYYDNILFTQDSADILLASDMDAGSRSYAYITDNIQLSDRFHVEPGLRVTFHAPNQQLYLQPRLSLSYQPVEKFQVMAAWGIYNQFISKTLQTDDNGNLHYYWTLSDGSSIPVLRSVHYVASLGYTPRPNILMNVEGFYKETDGIVRFQGNLLRNRLIQGDSRSKGIDVLLKGEYKHFSAWVAYTLQKTEELYPQTKGSGFISAPHDQRHEVKMTGILKMKPFYVSATYIYGSGFPDTQLLIQESKVFYPTDYQRLDVAAVYKKELRLGTIEAGISILNVTNHTNLKYSNFTYTRTSENTKLRIESEAVPFTPTLFLTIEL